MTHSSAAPVPYVEDIHAQPEALQNLLDAGITAETETVIRRFPAAGRVVLTGMGASLHAMYPSYLRLLRAGIPAWLVETAELLGPAGGLITAETAVWITSQSGRTAEVTALMQAMPVRPALTLVVTNHGDSPLAAHADAVVLMRCGVESTVGTRSYTNSLAVSKLVTDRILGTGSPSSLDSVPTRLADYLAGWREHVDRLDELVPVDTALFALGRHSSLAATFTGALIVKEAAAHAIEPLSSPQFRHGPLEMAGSEVTALILAGDEFARPLNQRLREELEAFGAHAVWLDPRGGSCAALPWLDDDETRPFAEILPFQALSVALARRTHREPGSFQRIGKVTTTL